MKSVKSEENYKHKRRDSKEQHALDIINSTFGGVSSKHRISNDEKVDDDSDDDDDESEYEYNSDELVEDSAVFQNAYLVAYPISNLPFNPMATDDQTKENTPSCYMLFFFFLFFFCFVFVFLCFCVLQTVFSYVCTVFRRCFLE